MGCGVDELLDGQGEAQARGRELRVVDLSLVFVLCQLVELSLPDQEVARVFALVAILLEHEKLQRNRNIRSHKLTLIGQRDQH